MRRMGWVEWEDQDGMNKARFVEWDDKYVINR